VEGNCGLILPPTELAPSTGMGKLVMMSGRLGMEDVEILCMVSTVKSNRPGIGEVDILCSCRVSVSTGETEPCIVAKSCSLTSVDNHPLFFEIQYFWMKVVISDIDKIV